MFLGVLKKSIAKWGQQRLLGTLNVITFFKTERFEALLPMLSFLLLTIVFRLQN